MIILFCSFSCSVRGPLASELMLILTFPVWPILIIGGSAPQAAHENSYKWKTWIAWEYIHTIFNGLIGLCECHKEITLHTYTMQAPSTMNYTFTSCTLCMHGLNALNSRLRANVKMSHSKSQIEPRWLMSHRLGTPGLDHQVLLIQFTAVRKPLELYGWN